MVFRKNNSAWLGWRDSNPRMHGPKPCALPLGDIPTLHYFSKNLYVFQEILQKKQNY